MIRRNILWFGVLAATFICPGTRGQQVTTGTQSTLFYTFQLGAGGCVPSSQTVPAGVLGVFLRNLSSVQNLTVQLQTANGTVVSSQALTTAATTWTQVFSLPAGTYTLQAVGQTGLSCTLIAQ